MVLTVLAYFHFEAKNSICNKFRIALDDSKVTFRPHLKKAIVQSVQHESFVSKVAYDGLMDLLCYHQKKWIEEKLVAGREKNTFWDKVAESFAMNWWEDEAIQSNSTVNLLQIFDPTASEDSFRLVHEASPVTMSLRSAFIAVFPFFVFAEAGARFVSKDFHKCPELVWKRLWLSWICILC